LLSKARAAAVDRSLERVSAFYGQKIKDRPPGALPGFEQEGDPSCG